MLIEQRFPVVLGDALLAHDALVFAEGLADLAGAFFRFHLRWNAGSEPCEYLGYNPAQSSKRWENSNWKNRSCCWRTTTRRPARSSRLCCRREFVVDIASDGGEAIERLKSGAVFGHSARPADAASSMATRCSIF